MCNDFFSQVESVMISSLRWNVCNDFFSQVESV